MEESKPKKDFLFIPGVILIFLGLFIAGVPYFFILGIPIYIVGAICVGFSKKTNESKVRWILIPLGIYIILVYLIYQIYWKINNVT